ncbi:acetate--CoA ligase family protein [Halobellus sp. GM3]|uniref:acetate--CoA ligase family protein n=1 Tax=Halobellus sp. GM3 TaxID=3458410 RepID=UPI00403D702E
MTDDPIVAALAAGRTTLTEPESKRLLEAYGVDVPDFEVVSSASTAAEAAERIGGPVVAKLSTSSVAHKSEWGGGIGVQTGIDTPDAAASAASAILEEADEQGVDASVLIEESADLDAGTEIIVGGSRNPSFGPSVLVGLGGVFAEIYEDTAHRLAPLSPATARDAIDELRAAPLLEGYRGRPPADVGALADVVTAVGDLLENREEIAEIDVNPVFVSPAGARALDAHIVLHG